MAKADVSREQARERVTVLTFLIGYGAFVVGTILIPISSTAGGLVFWAGVFVIFWGGWSSSRK